MKNKLMKKAQGITLIALVVTIVVLLILAATSISMLTGENGIITQAQNAKLETRAGNVREEVDLWKTENALRKTNNEEQISKETMLSNLKNKGILYEEEINRQEEIITIGKNIIPYGTEDEKEVTIHISKTPPEDLTMYVELQVTSVEGLGENIQLESEEQYMELLLNKINSMTDSERETLYVNISNRSNQEAGLDIYYENFEDLLQDMYAYDEIKEPTKEAFYERIENEGGIGVFNENIAYTIYELEYNLIGELDYDTGILKSYVIINPVNEEKDNYIATQNGDYTFIVEDTITGKQYSKTVNVSNIARDLEENEQYHVANIGEFISSNPYDYDSYIGLMNEKSNLPTTFNSAFIIYNDQLIEITDLINIDNNISYLYGNDIVDKIGREIYGTQQSFIFMKDGTLCPGEAYIYGPG